MVAFTAAQIPGIERRCYPPELAGPLYPDGIPIVAEAELESVCREQSVSDVVFAYSDVSYATVMEVASRVLAAGAGFRLLGPDATTLKADVPVIAVCAVRTGCGKSQTTRWLSARARADGRHQALQLLEHRNIPADAKGRQVEHRSLTGRCSVDEDRDRRGRRGLDASGPGRQPAGGRQPHPRDGQIVGPSPAASPSSGTTKPKLRATPSDDPACRSPESGSWVV